MVKQKLCAFCALFGRKRKAKKGYALCEEHYNMQEEDEKLMVKTGNQAHFICPICKRDIGNRVVCPYCGTIRFTLMSEPYHCSVCNCQYYYFKNNDINSQPLCWCCGSPFKPSNIDDYINFALKHFDEYVKEKECS